MSWVPVCIAFSIEEHTQATSFWFCICTQSFLIGLDCHTQQWCSMCWAESSHRMSMIRVKSANLMHSNDRYQLSPPSNISAIFRPILVSRASLERVSNAQCNTCMDFYNTSNYLYSFFSTKLDFGNSDLCLNMTDIGSLLSHSPQRIVDSGDS